MMDIKNLLSGIAVVIDDALDPTAQDDDRRHDLIFKIIERLEQNWNIIFLRAPDIPPASVWKNLLQSASFILLDWKLWPVGASEKKRDTVQRHGRFLRKAEEHLVPVFIFTNESTSEVVAELEATGYRYEMSSKSVVFLQTKDQLLSDASPVVGPVQQWMEERASVYALKTWDHLFRAARTELFSSMHGKSADWPKVFWRECKEDRVDPSMSLTHMINDSLRSRMRTNAFDPEIMDPDIEEGRVAPEDLQALISAVSFQETPPDDHIRCGDLFEHPEKNKKFLLNIRPDCDCIPRNGVTEDDVELYCIEGKRMKPGEVRKEYNRNRGRFDERGDQSIVFAAGTDDEGNGRSIRFRFKNLEIREFKELKGKRCGRLLHPYLTKIQQRYAMYLQRQGVPRIPPQAVSRQG